MKSLLKRSFRNASRKSLREGPLGLPERFSASLPESRESLESLVQIPLTSLLDTSSGESLKESSR